MAHTTPITENVVVPRKKQSRNQVGVFQKMGLSDAVLKGVLFMGYKLPTPIQRKCIPNLLDGHDMCAMARTGSGKSAAFIIPMLQNLKEHSTNVGARALILSPTRDLALQTARFAKKISKYQSLRICSIIGGEAVTQQFNGLAMNPDIIIATPGRLSFLLKEIPTFNLHRVRHLVFDEADRLFELGFAVQIRHIMNSLSKDNKRKRQTMLFSATLPESVEQFSRATLTNPIMVRLDTDIKVSPDLQLSYLYCRDDDKLALLLYLLHKLTLDDKLVLIFAGTRWHVELIQAFLRKHDVQCLSCFGSMQPSFRKSNIKRFSEKKVPVMVVTDVAARGLDIPLLDYVINFQMSTSVKAFVHRVGRVARNGQTGVAISIVNADELPYLADVYRFLEHPLPVDEQSAAFGTFVEREREPIISTATTSTAAISTAANIDEHYGPPVMDEVSGGEEAEVYGPIIAETEDALSDDSEGGMDDNVMMDPNGVIRIDPSRVEEEEEEMAFNGLFKTVSPEQKKEAEHKSLMFTDKVSFGAVPASVLRAYVVTVLDCLENDCDLAKMKETCDKSMDIYCRTRTRPTKSGIRAAKDIDCRIIHPLFEDQVGEHEYEQNAMMQSISKFKANTTIFETGGASNPSYKAMQMKRKQVDRTVYGENKRLTMKQKEVVRRKERAMREQRMKKQLKTVQQYRSSQFFIESDTSNAKQREFEEDVLKVNEEGGVLKKFVMELDADEESAIDKKKKLYRFNHNTGKFVTEFMGDRIKRYMNERNESNRKMHDDKNHNFGKLYHEWTRRTMKEIEAAGSLEKDETAKIKDKANWRALKDLGRRKYRHYKGTEEWFENKRARARLVAMKDETMEKYKKRKERAKKEQRKRFKDWWKNNKDNVKARKGVRRRRPF